MYRQDMYAPNIPKISSKIVKLSPNPRILSPEIKKNAN